MSCWCLAHVVLLVNTNGADGRNLSKYRYNGVNLMLVLLTQYDILSLRERLNKRNVPPYRYNTAVTCINVQR